MKHNFPRLDDYQSEELSIAVLAEVFPWGCSQLTKVPPFLAGAFGQGSLKSTAAVPSQGSHFRCNESESRENIYRAIKYGVWSTSDKDYTHKYSEFKELKKARPEDKVYWGLYFEEEDRKVLLGIAEVIAFEPEQAFGFWQDTDGAHIDMQGVIQLKFIAVGRTQITPTKKNQYLEPFYKQLRESQFSYEELHQSDLQEDILREKDIFSDQDAIQKKLEEFGQKVRLYCQRPK